MTTTISETQDLVLQLIEKNSFNNFSGPRVVKDLRSHSKLWRAVLMTDLLGPVYRDLKNPVTTPTAPIPIYQRVSLRGLSRFDKDDFPADHLVIYAEPHHQDDLEELANGWGADECYWVPVEEAVRALGARASYKREFGEDERVLLLLWWD